MTATAVKILHIPAAISLLVSMIVTRGIAFIFGRLISRPSVPVLKTIKLSHYCEKARWALDLCDVTFEEETHPPLIHHTFLSMATRGKTTQTPVLSLPDKTVIGSGSILRHLSEQGHAWLYPNEQVAELEQYFDDELGPNSRRIVYHHLFKDKVGSKTIKQTWARKFTYTWESWWLKALFPSIAMLMGLGLDCSAKGCQRGLVTARAVFDRVEALLSDGRRYLANTERISAADITFAALGYPLVMPPQFNEIAFPYAPELIPQELYDLIAEFRARPAGQFILRLYNEERVKELV